MANRYVQIITNLFFLFTVRIFYILHTQENAISVFTKYFEDVSDVSSNEHRIEFMNHQVVFIFIALLAASIKRLFYTCSFRKGNFNNMCVPDKLPFSHDSVLFRCKDTSIFNNMGFLMPIILNVYPISRGFDDVFRQNSDPTSLTNSASQMYSEWMRLASFRFLASDVPISAIRLARDGLYLSTDGRSVMCYSCDFTRTLLSVTDPLQEHRRCQSHCRHLLGTDDRNVQIQVEQNTPTSDEQTSGENEIPHSSQMNYQWLRLRSYHSMSFDVDFSAVRLAANGLFLSRDGRSLICFSCGLVQTLEASMDPILKHTTHSPSCRHLLGTDNHNVPISPRLPLTNLTQNHESSDGTAGACTSYSSVLPYQESFDYQPDTHSDRRRMCSLHCNISKANCTVDATQQGRVCPQIPRYLAYESIEIRKHSFQNVSGRMDHIYHDIATAGFFYTGYGDYIRCFFCGGGLRNWGQGDDPWMEHARWFPNCAFLLRHKGQGYVQSVRQSHEEKVGETSLSSQDLYQ